MEKRSRGSEDDHCIASHQCDSMIRHVSSECFIFVHLRVVWPLFILGVPIHSKKKVEGPNIIRFSEMFDFPLRLIYNLLVS